MMGSCKVVFLLVFLVASVIHSSKAIDCNLVASTILSCSGFLKDSNPTQPLTLTTCCNAVDNLFRLGDVKSLCKCLTPLTQGFLPSKAHQIPSLCNLPNFSPLLTCIAPSSGAMLDSFLPPLGPLPPIFSFPPFNFPPLPPISLPLPPVWFPSPPMVPDTPVPAPPMPLVPETPVPAPSMP